MPDTRPRFLGVELYFDDLQSATRFYRDTLGLDLAEDSPGITPSLISPMHFSALKRWAWSPIPCATKPLSSLKWAISHPRSTLSDQAASSTPSRTRAAIARPGPFSTTPRGT